MKRWPSAILERHAPAGLLHELVREHAERLRRPEAPSTEKPTPQAVIFTTVAFGAGSADCRGQARRFRK